MGDLSWILLILSRYVHVLCACLLVGGVFLLTLQFSARKPDGSAADEPVYLRGRRVLKMTVHIALLFILASGVFNLMMNWPAYGGNVPLTHALLGTHLLLGLVGLIGLLGIFAEKTVEPGDGKKLAAMVAVLFLAVLMASSLKYAREHPKKSILSGPSTTESLKS